MKKFLQTKAPQDRQKDYMLPFKPLFPKVLTAAFRVADPVIPPYKLAGVEFEGRFLTKLHPAIVKGIITVPDNTNCFLEEKSKSNLFSFISATKLSLTFFI